MILNLKLKEEILHDRLKFSKKNRRLHQHLNPVQHHNFRDHLPFKLYKVLSTDVNVLRKGPEEIAYVVENQFVILMDAMTKENVGLDRKKRTETEKLIHIGAEGATLVY